MLSMSGPSSEAVLFAQMSSELTRNSLRIVSIVNDDKGESEMKEP